jgi:hypothetical protein
MKGEGGNYGTYQYFGIKRMFSSSPLSLSPPKKRARKCLSSRVSSYDCHCFIFTSLFPSSFPPSLLFLQIFLLHLFLFLAPCPPYSPGGGGGGYNHYIHNIFVIAGSLSTLLSSLSTFPSWLLTFLAVECLPPQSETCPCPACYLPSTPNGV